jgi:hypothetical protein
LLQTIGKPEKLNLREKIFAKMPVSVEPGFLLDSTAG